MRHRRARSVTHCILPNSSSRPHVYAHVYDIKKRSLYSMERTVIKIHWKQTKCWHGKIISVVSTEYTCGVVIMSFQTEGI